jgi:prepilin peptidase CpaA
VSTIAPPLAMLLGLLGVLAGAYDLRYRRIPNWLVIAGFFGGLLINTWLSGLRGGYFALTGTGLAIAVYIPLYLLRAVGGGDLKLMAAVGAIVGPAIWLVLFVIASLLGGVAAIVLVLAHARFAHTLSNVSVILRELLHLRQPYRTRPELDVTTNQGLRLPHGTLIAVAIGLYLAGIWLG